MVENKTGKIYLNDVIIRTSYFEMPLRLLKSLSSIKLLVSVWIRIIRNRNIYIYYIYIFETYIYMSQRFLLKNTLIRILRLHLMIVKVKLEICRDKWVALCVYTLGGETNKRRTFNYTCAVISFCLFVSSFTCFWNQT